MSFKKFYEEKLDTLTPTHLEPNILDYKPSVYGGLFAPDTSAELTLMGHTFKIDKDGMLSILDMVDNWWNNCEPSKKDNFLYIIATVSNIVTDYLGTKGNARTRQIAYSSAPKFTLTMSEIKCKGIAQCTERSIITHQILNILNETGVISYKSSVVNSRLHTNGSEPHSFILLEHQEIIDKRVIFDVENPLSVVKDDNGTLIYPALYPINNTEYESFMSGQTITPKSYWETKGLEVLDETRSYGNDDSISM